MCIDMKMKSANLDFRFDTYVVVVLLRWITSLQKCQYDDWIGKGIGENFAITEHCAIRQDDTFVLRFGSSFVTMRSFYKMRNVPQTPFGSKNSCSTQKNVEACHYVAVFRDLLPNEFQHDFCVAICLLFTKFIKKG